MRTQQILCTKNRQILSGFIILAISSFSFFTPRAQVLLDSVKELEGVGVTEHLGAKIPLDLAFTDDHGRQVRLREYFSDGKPVVLNLVYFQCPMLCNLVLNGVTNASRQLEWNPGTEYRMVAISINPRETYDLAASKKASYLNELNKPGSEHGWSFLVGDSTQSQALADALGWGYCFDQQSQEYVHAATTFVITPDGAISRYLYGIEYEPRDFKLALLEASEGKFGSTLDKLILYCFHYDPEARGYVLFAQNVMKLGGAAAVIILGILLTTLWRRERLSRHRSVPVLGQR